MSVTISLPSANKKEITVSFTAISLTFLFISTLLLATLLARFYAPDFTLKHVPNTLLPLIGGTGEYGILVFFSIAFVNLLSAILLLMRKKIAVIVSQSTFFLMALLTFHTVFSNDHLTLLEAFNLFFTFIFYTTIAVYAFYVNRKGWLTPLFLKERGHSATLTIQKGCNNTCAYCTVPLKQGGSKNDAEENVLKNAKRLAGLGYKEVVLSGTNISDFYKEKRLTKSLRLLQKIDRIGNIDRFRFSSISSPVDLLNDETLEFIANSTRFAPHFFIRLQSGSQELLKKMQRNHSLQDFKERIEKIKELMPHAYVSVKIITGLPGETEELFLETYNYLKGLEISEIYAHPYIDDPDKEASKMGGAIPESVRQERTKILLELSNKKRTTFYENQLGSQRTVLFERVNKDGYIYGYTENYIKVKTLWDPKLANTTHKITFTRIDKDHTVLFNFLKKRKKRKKENSHI